MVGRARGGGGWPRSTASTTPGPTTTSAGAASSTGRGSTRSRRSPRRRTVTSRIRLGTLVASPNFRHPVHFAREVTALDDISAAAGSCSASARRGGTGFDADRARPAGADRRGSGPTGSPSSSSCSTCCCARTGSPGAASTTRAVDARSTARLRAVSPGCRSWWRPTARARRALAARFGQGWVTTGGPADDLDGWWRVVADAAAAVHRGAGTRPDGIRPLWTVTSPWTRAPVYSLSQRGRVHRRGRPGGRARLHRRGHALAAARTSWYAGDEAVLEAVAAEVLPTL